MNRMSLPGFLRGRLTRLRMVRAGLLERDGARYFLTSRGRAFASLRDAYAADWRS